MGKTVTFNCRVITPEREVLDTPASSVVFTAHDGQVGILLHRAPLLTKLGIGSVRVDAPDGARRLFVDGGFAQMLDDTLTLLTQQAMPPADIDVSAARADLDRARSLPNTTEAEFAARQDAIRRAEVQITLASDHPR